MDFNTDVNMFGTYTGGTLKVVGFVLGVPTELVLFTNVYKGQESAVKSYINSGIERIVDTSRGCCSKGDPTKTITTEEGYIVHLKDIMAYRFIREVK